MIKNHPSFVAVQAARLITPSYSENSIVGFCELGGASWHF